MNRSTRSRIAVKATGIALLLVAGGLPAGEVDPEPVGLVLRSGGVHGNPGVLRGPDSSQQLVATLESADGSVSDATRSVSYSAEPSGIVMITPDGRATPVGNGETVVRVSLGEHQAEARLEVKQAETPLRINFPNEVVPVFTKYGCNGGGCHGKSAGQNGFRLSLLGFEPQEDFEHLVKEARGRRIFPASPRYSLLLRKATGELPHGGGSRLGEETPEYLTLLRWIEQGTPYGETSDPVVQRVEVYPRERILPAGAEQQLQVTAFYSDGTARDTSRVAQYESNQKEMAEVSGTGLVALGQIPGDAAIMIRFQEFVDVFRVTIPLGAPVESLPEPRSFVDELVFEKLRTLGLPPSGLCDDATFLRRVSMDITGKAPALEETRAFLADGSPGKRTALVDRLLESTAYADYFANKWSAILRNKRRDDKYQRGTFAFHAWLRENLDANEPFDRLITQLVAASGEAGRNPAVNWFRAVDKREEQLQDVAQVFMGVRLQCAQCHHHPFEKWSQRDYHGFAAFFSQIGRKPGLQPGEQLVFHQYGKASVRNPKTNEDLPPMPLGDAPLELEPEMDPRLALAEWMTAPDNPFFSRMLVNRYWKHFLGRGLVEPEDDIRLTNPPTNPKLLDALAEHFTESGFDLKGLVRTICTSATYQLEALPNQYNAGDRQNYSRFFPRRLPAEALLDAVDALTGVPTPFSGQPAGVRAVQLPDDRFNADSYFLTVFGRPEMDSACECERTNDANLAQSLHLLNSKAIQDKLSHPQGVAAVYAADPRSDEEKVRELYLRAFARLPSGDEARVALQYLERKKQEVANSGEAGVSYRQIAYEDMVWALINTKEFLFNH
ncbi:MAG TPA: DUF1549 domain-containing protein [Verrucomicrobiales bacterium]|nr:DUF1549 domain-containing protein [Verrucomicrobiales bacterium]